MQSSIGLPRYLLYLLLVAARLAAAEPVLDTIAKVRALSPEDAARALPVSLEATVVFYDPSCLSLFVSDPSACTYVDPPSRTAGLYSSLALEPGSRVKIEGVSNEGAFFPIIRQHRIELLGKGVLPVARVINEAELLSPALDSEWVEVPAVVTGIEVDRESKSLAVEVYGRTLKAEIPKGTFSTERAAALMQHPVRLRGCVGTVFNTERQMTGRVFYVPTMDQIIPTDAPAPDSNPPLRAVNHLLRSDDTERMMVRVAGIVTQPDGNNFYLRDETGSLLVYTAGKDLLVAGDHVEAEGFAAIAPFRPILRARRVTVTGHTAVPPPKTLDFQEKQLPRFHGELIEQDADFLARREGSSDVVLQCRMGDRFFEAVLPPGSALPDLLEPGDHVRLTGICELTTTHPFPRVEWVTGFRVHLPKQGGVVILRRAPWWTLRRMFAILGMVSAAAFVAFAWVWLLRQRVKTQSEIIGSQLQREAVQDERQRIARELHDTVEQELSSLSIQLDGISDEIDDQPPQVTPQVRSSIQIARKMLRHCREDARASIRDLRNIELEQRGLAGALEDLLPVAASGCGAHFQIQCSGEPRPLTVITENHLLRIAQEAVTNAARHADASNITVELDYAPATVTLTIRDDGRGFNPATPAPDGHFGLRGIRERSNKLQAALDLHSAPGAGTTIRVTVATALTSS